MGTSSIVVSALTAVPTVRGNKLTWVVTDPWPKETHYSLDAVEVHASTTNDRATATKVGEGNTGDFLHAGLAEEQAWYYWIKPRDKLGDYGAWHPSSATAGVSATAIGMAGMAFGMANGKLVASVASNALTVAVKTAAGNDPSAADPVYVAFRIATLSAGGYVIRAITAALSFTIPAGTLFFNHNEPFRLWWEFFDDGGTIRLSVSKHRDGASIYPLAEQGLASAQTFSGTPTSGVMYASQAITSKAFRIVGYTEWLPNSLATGGNFSAVPDIIVMFGPGVKKPGDLVATNYKAVSSTDSSAPSAANVIPYDNTIPQDTEGVFGMDAVLTPQSAANSIEFSTTLNLVRSTAGILILAVFIAGSADAIKVATAYSGADIPTSLSARIMMPLEDSGAVVIEARYGVDSAAVTLYFNRNAGGAVFGLFESEVTLREFMG